jgi:hypothetical protein
MSDSSLIQLLAKVDPIWSLEPCTTDIQPFVVPYPCDLDRNIVLVDTPGFNTNGDADEVEKLTGVADWLGRM